MIVITKYFIPKNLHQNYREYSRELIWVWEFERCNKKRKSIGYYRVGKDLSTRVRDTNGRKYINIKKMWREITEDELYLFILTNGEINYD